MLRLIPVALLASLGADIATAQTLTPSLPIVSNAPRVLEGNSGTTTLPFVLRMPTSTIAPTAVTIRYRTVDQSATAGSDYVATQGEVVFTTTVREHTINVQVNGDTLVEPDEVLMLELTGANQQLLRVPGWIQNDDGNAITPGPNAIVPISTTVQEPASGFVEARLPVRLLRPAATEVRVDWTIAAGSATAGSDYTAAGSGTLVFAPGALVSEIPVRVLADNLVEPPERVRFAFGNPIGLPLARNLAELTIVDRSAISPVTSGIAAVLCRNFVSEGDAARVLLRRLGNLSGPVSVNYATINGTALAPDDYAATTGSVSWNAGDAGHRLVTVQTLNDDETELPESFAIGFSGATGANWIGPPQLRIVIRDVEAVSVDGMESACSGDEDEAGFAMQ